MNAQTTTKSTGQYRDVPLAKLRFGHDPLAGPEINARVSGRIERIDEMEAMLRERGQLYPLLVVENPTGAAKSAGLFFVFGGNRRLAALHLIHADGKLGVGDAPVPCSVFPPGTNAYELSLAENNTLPLHPVERFRGFAEVLRRDKIKPADAPGEIARRFGLTAKQAGQALALGALDDAVLDAWLAGKIGAESARVFTLCADKKDQARILKAALDGQSWNLEPENLRDRIVGRKKDVAGLVSFVGVEAYRAAGGELAEDLFGERHVVHHPEIASKLARDKLDESCAALVAAGWMWARRADAMPPGWQHNMGGFDRLPVPKTPPMTDDERARRATLLGAAEEAERGEDGDAEEAAQEALEAFDSTMTARGYPAASMKRAGCVVEVTEQGRLKVVAGVVRPDEAKKQKEERRKAERTEQAKAPGPKKEAAISAALATKLSTALTRAAAKVVAENADPRLVKQIAVAALGCAGTFQSHCVRIEGNGVGTSELLGDDEREFASELKKVSKLTDQDLSKRFARLVGASLNLQNASPDRLLVGDREEVQDEDVAALVHFLPTKWMQAALRAEFDADEYFEGAPGQMALDALADCGVPAPKNAKKAALAKVASEVCKKVGWMPPQLRTSGYAGPKARPAPKKASRKKRL